jgi:hypothetical protein
MTHVQTATSETPKRLLEATASCYTKAGMPVSAHGSKDQLAVVHEIQETMSTIAGTSATAGMTSTICMQHCLLVLDMTIGDLHIISSCEYA